MFKDTKLIQTANFMIKELLCCEPKSHLVITADTGSDREVVDALFTAASSQEVIPIVIWMPMLKENQTEPPPAVASALLKADRICSMEKGYFIHSNATRQALKEGARVDFFGGMDADSIIRCIGNLNFKEMITLGERLTKFIQDGGEMRITSEKGTNLYMGLDPMRPVYHHRGIADIPNDITFLGGQIAFAPIEESIHGKIVFDGTVWPPEEIGLLDSPIELTVENGKVIQVDGTNKAKHFEKWLKSFKHPNSYNVAHLSLGFNPGAKLLGNIIEDERVFGCIEIGIGAQSDHFNGKAGRAPSHCDGIILSPSFSIDGETIEEAGKYIHPELIDLTIACLGKNQLKGDR